MSKKKLYGPHDASEKYVEGIERLAQKLDHDLDRFKMPTNVRLDMIGTLAFTLLVRYCEEDWVAGQLTLKSFAERANALPPAKNAEELYQLATLHAHGPHGTKQ